MGAWCFVRFCSSQFICCDLVLIYNLYTHEPKPWLEYLRSNDNIHWIQLLIYKDHIQRDNKTLYVFYQILQENDVRLAIILKYPMLNEKYTILLAKF